MKKSALILALTGLSVMGLSAPRSVSAQSRESVIIQNKPIRLNMEGATLYSALKILFQQADADFTIAESLKTLPVTVRINQPFRIALAGVLKAAGQPITYEFADGIYRILPASASPDVPNEQSPPIALPEETILPQIFKPYVVVRKPRNLNGVDIAELLGGTIIRWIDGFSGTVGTMPNFFGNAGMGGFGTTGIIGGFGMGSFGGLTPQSIGLGGFDPFSQNIYQ